MKLRAARETLKKTQSQVAQEAKVTKQAYQRYEYEKREPSVSIAKRIAKALNSTVEDLF